jgi:hypothetical protein
MKDLMDELEEIMVPKPDALEVKGEDAPVKMEFKKKLTRKKKPDDADAKARAALKGPQPGEMK